MRVAGVDGCKAGWVVALLSPEAELEVRFADSFAAVLDVTADCAAVGVDMPIGLPDVQPPGGRRADVEARARLGVRKSSIFPAPARAVLQATSYEEAAALNRSHSVGNRSLTQQTWALVPKLREVDAAMTATLQKRVVEVHPELSFWALNDQQPMAYRKASAAGAFTRIRLLAERLGITLQSLEAGAIALGPHAALDDLLDAVVAAWTAHRVAKSTATCLPVEPDLDARGLRMEMWF